MLPEHEWLPLAQRLAVGMRERVRHRNERRPNLVVANERDKFWAYCQACREGAVHEKEHVRFTFDSPEAKKSDLSLPLDLIPVQGSVWESRVFSFMLSKGVHPCMAPDALYSHSRKRVLFDTGFGYMGRDVTGNALQKWLTYNGQHYLGSLQGEYAVVVEDAFSWYKLRWALQNSKFAGGVFCSLGTGQHDALVLELLPAKHVLFFYDGDDAGAKGAQAGARRLRAMGVQSGMLLAPPGMDPKDMEVQDLFNAVHGGLECPKF